MMRILPIVIAIAGLFAFGPEAHAAKPAGPSRAVAEGEGGEQLPGGPEDVVPGLLRLPGPAPGGLLLGGHGRRSTT